MSEKVGVVVVRLPWAVCEKVLEHGTAEKPYSRVLFFFSTSVLEVELQREKG